MSLTIDNPAAINVVVQPEENEFTFPRAQTKNVSQLLLKLGIRQGAALVAREGILLTPDIPLFPGDTILVRKVVSSG